MELDKYKSGRDDGVEIGGEVWGTLIRRWHSYYVIDMWIQAINTQLSGLVERQHRHL